MVLAVSLLFFCLLSAFGGCEYSEMRKHAVEILNELHNNHELFPNFVQLLPKEILTQLCKNVTSLDL